MAQCPLHHGWLVLLKTGACCGLSIFFEVTTNWRAGCQKLACPVRREGRPESSSLPLSRHTSLSSAGTAELRLATSHSSTRSWEGRRPGNGNRAPAFHSDRTIFNHNDLYGNGLQKQSVRWHPICC